MLSMYLMGEGVDDRHMEVCCGWLGKWGFIC